MPKTASPPARLNTERIRELRVRAGLSQEQAARKAGLKSRQAWNKIEAGRAGAVTLTTLGKVAAAVGAKPRDLLVD